MKILQGILKEELVNARRKLRLYQRDLKALPKGSIVPKRIKGHWFHYLAYRKGPRMVFQYKGKLDRKQLLEYSARQRQRSQYRQFVVDLKKQIAFLEKTLRRRSTRKGAAA